MGRIFKTLIVGFALKTLMLHPDFPRHKKKKIPTLLIIFWNHVFFNALFY